MVTISTPNVSYAGSPRAEREVGVPGSDTISELATRKGPIPKKPVIKRSWLNCISLAAPELRILLGFVMVATALATLWASQQQASPPSLETLGIPGMLAGFALLAFGPPLILNFRSTEPQWRFVAAMLGIGWRSTFSTMALLILMLSKAGQDFLLSSGLVACYFPLLVLQSWLLTRQAKRL